MRTNNNPAHLQYNYHFLEYSSKLKCSFSFNTAGEDSRGYLALGFEW